MIARQGKLRWCLDPLGPFLLKPAIASQLAPMACTGIGDGLTGQSMMNLTIIFLNELKRAYIPNRLRTDQKRSRSQSSITFIQYPFSGIPGFFRLPSSISGWATSQYPSTRVMSRCCMASQVAGNTSIVCVTLQPG